MIYQLLSTNTIYIYKPETSNAWPEINTVGQGLGAPRGTYCWTLTKGPGARKRNSPSTPWSKPEAHRSNAGSWKIIMIKRYMNNDLNHRSIVFFFFLWICEKVYLCILDQFLWTASNQRWGFHTHGTQIDSKDFFWRPSTTTKMLGKLQTPFLSPGKSQTGHIKPFNCILSMVYLKRNNTIV